MALHRKWSVLTALAPDVAIVPESAHPEIVASKCPAFDAASAVWVGENRNKGLAVFAFGDYSVELSAESAPENPWTPLIQVSGPVEFLLLAVWANNKRPHYHPRRGSPALRAIRQHGARLAAGDAVVAGDFNNNLIWDRPGRETNHALLVEELEQLGLASAYHAVTGEAHGEELQPTHYWLDRAAGGLTYHLDCCLVPRRWAAACSVTVGGFDEWMGSGLSDHVPVVVEMDVPRGAPPSWCGEQTGVLAKDARGPTR